MVGLDKRWVKYTRIYILIAEKLGWEKRADFARIPRNQIAQELVCLAKKKGRS